MFSKTQKSTLGILWSFVLFIFITCYLPSHAPKSQPAVTYSSNEPVSDSVLSLTQTKALAKNLNNPASSTYLNQESKNVITTAAKHNHRVQVKIYDSKAHTSYSTQVKFSEYKK